MKSQSRQTTEKESISTMKNGKKIATLRKSVVRQVVSLK